MQARLSNAGVCQAVALTRWCINQAESRLLRRKVKIFVRRGGRASHL
jgi:hypothetical protein